MNYEHKQHKYYSLRGELLTDVSVAQRLVQGQDVAVCWHSSDPAFFCLRRIIAGGRDGDLISNLQNQQQKNQTQTQKLGNSIC